MVGTDAVAPRADAVLAVGVADSSPVWLLVLPQPQRPARMYWGPQPSFAQQTTHSVCRYLVLALPFLLVHSLSRACAFPYCPRPLALD